MRALVTGVAGFIGSHLAEELVRRGDDVVGIDCFTPYYSFRLKGRNIRPLLSANRFSMRREDILRCDLGTLLRRIDVVFHLAAQPGVRSSWSMFDQSVRNNLLATQRILEGCGKHRKKLVFVSSSSVYGDSESYPTREDSPLNPISPYGLTKQAAERLCGLYERNGALKVVILRYFSVFGPRQRPDMAIHRFIELALRGLPLTVYGDGSQQRDYTYVSDIVAGTVAAADKDAWGVTMNLGGGRTSRLENIVRLVLEKTGSKSRVKYEPAQRGDVRKTAGDISRAKRTIGYRPKVGLEEGVGKQIDWQAARRKL